jgi:hypothetical protein
MDYLRIVKVPIHPVIIMLVGVTSVLMTICIWGAFNSAAFALGYMGAGFVQLWVFKYCYVLVERIADGAPEPPVLDTDMLSPTEIRPWIQLGLLAGGGWACYYIGGVAGTVLAIVLVLWIPASIAILGIGERPWEALNPLTIFRIVRGFGAHYFVLLAAMGLSVLLLIAVWRTGLLLLLKVSMLLWFEIAFFALVAGLMHARRHQIGYEPSRSPERAAAREEAERVGLRAKMLDDVFMSVRIGKHVDATAPLAAWFRNLDADYAERDAFHVTEQAIAWHSPAALNTIGSTLIRHLLRFGQPDAALAVFERLRGASASFTMDSGPDLRTLAEHADSIGRDDLAAVMRLETPVFHPPR